MPARTYVYSGGRHSWNIIIIYLFEGYPMYLLLLLLSFYFPPAGSVGIQLSLVRSPIKNEKEKLEGVYRGTNAIFQGYNYII